MGSCLQDLRRTNKLDVDDLTVESGLFKSFDEIVRRQLDPVWHTLGRKIKQLVADLRTLRKIAEHLLRYDSVTFLRFLDALKASESKAAIWIFVDPAPKIFELAKRRVYQLFELAKRRVYQGDTAKEKDRVCGERGGEAEGLGLEVWEEGGRRGSGEEGGLELQPVLEEMPKWKVLRELLEEIQAERSTQQQEEAAAPPPPSTATAQASLAASAAALPVLVACKDERTCHQLRDVLALGAATAMECEWQQNLLAKADLVKTHAVRLGPYDNQSTLSASSFPQFLPLSPSPPPPPLTSPLPAVTKAYQMCLPEVQFGWQVLLPLPYHLSHPLLLPPSRHRQVMQREWQHYLLAKADLMKANLPRRRHAPAAAARGGTGTAASGAAAGVGSAAPGSAGSGAGIGSGSCGGSSSRSGGNGASRNESGIDMFQREQLLLLAAAKQVRREMEEEEMGGEWVMAGRGEEESGGLRGGLAGGGGIQGGARGDGGVRGESGGAGARGGDGGRGRGRRGRGKIGAAAAGVGKGVEADGRHVRLELDLEVVERGGGGFEDGNEVQEVQGGADREERENAEGEARDGGGDGEGVKERREEKGNGSEEDKGGDEGTEREGSEKGGRGRGKGRRGRGRGGARGRKRGGVSGARGRGRGGESKRKRGGMEEILVEQEQGEAEEGEEEQEEGARLASIANNDKDGDDDCDTPRNPTTRPVPPHPASSLPLPARIRLEFVPPSANGRLPAVHLCTLEGASHVLERLQPGVVVVYDPDIELVRQIEVFHAARASARAGAAGRGESVVVASEAAGGGEGGSDGGGGDGLCRDRERMEEPVEGGSVTDAAAAPAAPAAAGAASARSQQPPLRVLFLFHEGSTEGHKFEASVRRENGAFEQLIRQKAVMTIPAEQVGGWLVASNTAADHAHPLPPLLLDVRVALTYSHLPLSFLLLPLILILVFCSPFPFIHSQLARMA
ncbi:unnamed protein product, partial [Closterium sp. NIES-53]